jgi:hypothetical protein
VPFAGVDRNPAAAKGLFNAALRMESGSPYGAAYEEEEEEGEEGKAFAAEGEAHIEEGGRGSGGGAGGAGAATPRTPMEILSAELQAAAFYSQTGAGGASGGAGVDTGAGTASSNALHGGRSADQPTQPAQPAEAREHAHTGTHTVTHTVTYNQARRWRSAGYFSPHTGGVAPAIALAVVYVDEYLARWSSHSAGVGANVGGVQGVAPEAVTVASLLRDTHQFLGSWVPSSLLRYLPAAVQPGKERTGNDRTAQNRASKRSKKVPSYSRAFYQRYARFTTELELWIEGLDDYTFETMVALAETVALLLVLIGGRWMLRALRPQAVLRL